MMRFMYDQATTNEAILYILERTDERFTRFFICKSLYFADIMHFKEYGTFITGDHYAAMEHGPVPSETYRELQLDSTEEHYAVRGYFPVGKYNYRMLRHSDKDMLSEATIECLDQAIDLIYELGVDFGRVSEHSHNSAWQEAWTRAKGLQKGSEDIPLESIIAEIGNSAESDWSKNIYEFLANNRI